MEIEEETAKSLFKNPKWALRKKELKQSRNQRQNKNLKQISANELLSKNKYNYMSIDAPGPTRRPKRYCDITGYETKYFDKSSGLYFCDKIIYTYIKGLNKPSIEQYLSLRKANTTT